MNKANIYALSTCPWCKKTKDYFTEHKIPFTYIDYDLADESTQKKISQEMDAAGASGFPFVKINSEVILGYKPERFSKVLGL